ncbi:YeaH/YhbH family protein [Arenibaculum pallidiluteum]|uniref:YeaH/YhbH family protein n=1 Tax=Arenibaculum pallidiluteum TaxID=2812559 RepID=UPI001A96C392|nr:YeaH/YhbH family protein [Arenibaculum pallidiluteum]
MNIIDRRLNPQGKSLANRQRFLRRAKEQIVKAVRDSSSRRSIQDIENGEKISIPTGGVREPSFHHGSSGGLREHVVPGNKEYVEGDRIPRPQGGGQGRGNEASDSGEGEDDFRFVLSRDEFLDIFLEDLELPDLVKQKVKRSESYSIHRAGYSPTGSPSNLNLVRTMRNSLSRRIALKRPKPAEIEELEQRIRELEGGHGDVVELQELREQLERYLRRSRLIPYLDPIDVRYNRFERVPRPVAQAVMFCLMDVSGSMTEHMKDLAKRFFMLLFLFLKRRYRHVDIVFIRHTHEAKEVDEETFFYSTETGGTIVSTALEEMQKVVRDRYPPDEWNIYAAQASDGDNMSNDNSHAASLLEDVILPMCQYFAYIEVAQDHEGSLGGALGAAFGRETDLWRTYKHVANKPGQAMAMRRVKNRREIFPVFRELFARENAPG